MMKNQKGFSAVELVMAIVIVGLLGAVGYLVYQKHNDSAATMSSLNKSKSSSVQKKSPKAATVTSYAECIKTPNAKINTRQYPPTCNTEDNIVFRPTDPNNFTKVGQKIDIPNFPYVTTDNSVAEKDGYCFNNEVPGPQARASLDKLTGDYALVRAWPNCGDSFELAYQREKNNWTVINTSHLGLCFRAVDIKSEITTPKLQAAADQLCK